MRIPLFNPDGTVRTAEGVEREIIINALIFSGSIARAARDLGVGRMSIYRKTTVAERQAIREGRMNGACFRKDGKLKYRAIGGDVYDATQVGEPGPTGLLSIFIKLPGVKDPVMLNRVRMREESSGEEGDGGEKT